LLKTVEYFKERRYLTSFNTSHLPQVFTDVLVIGTGVAGLRAALAAADHCPVLLLAKDSIGETNTAQAQGGIAAAMAPMDTAEAHCADTLSTGHGLCDESVVTAITREAPERINELIHWGGQFDREGDELAFTREGGHSASRIVHAQGDATGLEVSNTLIRKVREEKNIQIMAKAYVLDLIATDADGCIGALIHDARRGRMVIWAKQTIVATGGAGRLFRETTNSRIATGDGIAMAYRAGAELCDIEFYQFHPTALYVAGAARALISEAVRGEGGLLLNARKERFMPKYHERAELAPRDAVSRAIVTEIRDTDHTCAYLDVRHLPAEQLKKRFPTICKLCAQFDIDMTRDLVPIRPAAHYMIGGIRVGLNGASSIPRLWACGEAACTGLHGANRLGSNSLLEGLVVGYHAGSEAAQAAATEGKDPINPRISIRLGAEEHEAIDVADVTNALRAVAWRDLGIERSRYHLEEAIHMMRFWGRYVMDKEFDHHAGWELQNALLIARLLGASALMREESRGVHYRTDFSDTHDDRWRVRLVLTCNAPTQRIPL